MTWLDSLPHQIPFRAASTATEIDGKTIAGSFLCTANDESTAEVMLVEAMAQLGGGLAFRNSGTPGLLTGIDRCEILRAIGPGDRVEITVTLDATFGGTHRFSALASVAGLECARGRFYLTAAHPAAT
jgi:3-hydroxymyristoyl/3-hydroxydecanoyl-(acyl carrier protein) dehydratase